MSVPVKPSLPPSVCLAFGLEDIDMLFPGFVLGDFGVLYGLPACLSLSFLLCVRCQLGAERGGLDSSVVFVDGRNTFDVYETSRVAQKYGLDPRATLERILISRAFTAYQLTSLILERLKAAVDRFSAKLVILSDALGLYLDRDVPKTEAMDVFNKLTVSLAKFAADNKVIIVATHLIRRPSSRSLFLESALLGRANVAIRIKSMRQTLRFVLEKHPSYRLGTAEFPSEGLTLKEFMEV
jgi:hypothetical protein